MGISQTQEIKKKKNQTRNLSKITKQINSTSNGSLQNIKQRKTKNNESLKKKKKKNDNIY
jgi:hypothetical protein